MQVASWWKTALGGFAVAWAIASLLVPGGHWAWSLATLAAGAFFLYQGLGAGEDTGGEKGGSPGEKF